MTPDQRKPYPNFQSEEEILKWRDEELMKAEEFHSQVEKRIKTSLWNAEICDTLIVNVFLFIGIAPLGLAGLLWL